MNHDFLCFTTQSEDVNSSLFRFADALVAVDLAAHHQASHHVEHLQSAVAVDVELVAALVDEHLVCSVVLIETCVVVEVEDEFETALGIVCRGFEMICRRLQQVEFLACEVVEESESEPLDHQGKSQVLAFSWHFWFCLF